MKLTVQSLFVLVVTVTASIGNAQDVSYFRHDHGVAKGDHALPDDFEKDAKQLWRTPLDKGHSTPCVWDVVLRSRRKTALGETNGPLSG